MAVWAGVTVLGGPVMGDAHSTVIPHSCPEHVSWRKSHSGPWRHAPDKCLILVVFRMLGSKGGGSAPNAGKWMGRIWSVNTLEQR